MTEEMKVRIIELHAVHGNRWSHIGRIVGLPESTVRTFYKRYLQNGQLSPKRGPPFKITQEQKQDVVDITLNMPDIHLDILSDIVGISTTSCKKILNENKIYYLPKIARTPLTDQHKENRFSFCRQFATLDYSQMPFIVFTDESTVCVDLNTGCIWRRRGEYPAEAFFDKTQHPKSVMVWGAIGPYGYRSQLIWVKNNLDSEAYLRMLAEHQIPQSLTAMFPGGFWWQQDNAPAHSSRRTRAVLKNVFPNMLDWPAKSPDLSPIEQVWDYIKNKSKGKNFLCENDLFSFLLKEWMEIPDHVVHNFYTSFLARCKVCAAYHGEHLNGHWKDVKKVHDTYRTNLVWLYDARLGRLRRGEQPARH